MFEYCRCSPASAFTAPVRAISSSRSRSGNGVPSRHQRESSESRVSPAEWESRSRSVRSATGEPASSSTWSPTVSSSRSRPCSLSRMIASAVNVLECEAIRRRCVVRSGIPADSSAEPTATSAISSPSCQIAAWKPDWRCARRTVSSHSGSIAATSSTAERGSGDAASEAVAEGGTDMASPSSSTVARADYGRGHPRGAVSITLVKPFVQIATRPEDDVAATEREAVLDFTGLTEEQLIWARLDRDPFPDIAAADISGIILCGSPFTVSDPAETKTPAQVRAEAEIFRVLDQVIAHDIPFLRACYGIGTLGTHQGALIDRTHGEPLGAVEVALPGTGRQDPLIREAALPERFTGLVGHKEAVHTLPEHATVLAPGTSS